MNSIGAARELPPLRSAAGGAAASDPPHPSELCGTRPVAADGMVIKPAQAAGAGCGSPTRPGGIDHLAGDRDNPTVGPPTGTPHLQYPAGRAAGTSSAVGGNMIDNILSQPWSAADKVRLALIWPNAAYTRESAADALGRTVGACISEAHRQGLKRPLAGAVWTGALRAQLVALWADLHKSVPEIATEMDKSPSAIKGAAERFGLPARGTKFTAQSKQDEPTRKSAAEANANRIRAYYAGIGRAVVVDVVYVPGVGAHVGGYSARIVTPVRAKV